ncbi:MFS transporter [Haladaptatus sp. DYF46]|uniref:MFS transporter n=1 Tax=Haladaptatus sp. DYF46 TaxID=2886041 RepID=UPI001E42E8E0|nr:MFS transporter [Haladaptatus sp. DYF46]
MNRRNGLPPWFVCKYYLYRATVTFGLIWPILVLYLRNEGLSFAQIALLNTVAMVVTLVGELPAGYVGDRIGHRNSLLTGSLLLCAACVGFVLADSFATFAVVWILWSFSNVFQSGNGDAWLYDMLDTRGDGDLYTHVHGRGGAVNLWTMAGTSLVAGGLYAIDASYPFLASAVLIGFGVPVLLSFPGANSHAADVEPFTVIDAVPVIREQLLSPSLRSFVLYMGVFVGVSMTAENFIQPIAVTRLSVSASGLGPLYAGFAVVGAVASSYAGRIETRLTTRVALIAFPLVTAVAFLLPLALPLLALPVFFLVRGTRTLANPIASGYINHRIESRGRATVLSAVAMVYALVRIPIELATGRIADGTSPLLALAALGVIFLGGAVGLRLWPSPIVASNPDDGGATDG